MSKLVNNFVYRPPSGDNNKDEPSLEELLGRLNIKIPKIPGLGSGSPFLGLIIILVVAILWIASGIYSVQPDEKAVLRTFGQYVATTEPGLRWHWPGPVGNTDIVAVTKTRRLELGFRGIEEQAGIFKEVPAEANMITGDENIVQAQAVIQYRISDPKAYLFHVDDPGESDRGIDEGQPDGKTLRDITETTLRQIVGSRNIDDILTTEKEAVQQEVLSKMREINEAYETGIDVQQVLLQNVNPPAAVQDAFEDVVRAREDRDRIINLAEAYQADQLPRAQGEAAKIIEAAEAYKEGRLQIAEGEAAGFEELLKAYKQSKDVTRTRLYLDAINEILPNVKKYIIYDSSAPLPLLQLGNNTIGGE
ncbi:MAG: FtsH protease activity modulator HflK [Chloroflexota bacterium]|nr:FtsH protease activity modulator HflK [Chloroflexota bacterium]